MKVVEPRCMSKVRQVLQNDLVNGCLQDASKSARVISTSNIDQVLIVKATRIEEACSISRKAALLALSHACDSFKEGCSYVHHTATI
jgi:hypothetical protein